VQRFNPFEDFKDTDTIAAAQRRNKELTLDDYEYLKEHATLIGKIGAKARGTPSQIKRNDQVLEDIFVIGATANTADIDNRSIANGRFFSPTRKMMAAREWPMWGLILRQNYFPPAIPSVEKSPFADFHIA